MVYFLKEKISMGKDKITSQDLAAQDLDKLAKELKDQKTAQAEKQKAAEAAKEAEGNTVKDKLAANKERIDALPADFDAAKALQKEIDKGPKGGVPISEAGRAHRANGGKPRDQIGRAHV